MTEDERTALVEAVARAIYRASQNLYTYEEFVNPVHMWGGVMVVNRSRLNSMATAAIAAVRAHDEQAELTAVERVSVEIENVFQEHAFGKALEQMSQKAAAAAIAAHSAYLRERVQDADVVEAVMHATQEATGPWRINDGTNRMYAGTASTAALDVLLGKEDDHDS